jgi:hypothetical protein
MVEGQGQDLEVELWHIHKLYALFCYHYLSVLFVVLDEGFARAAWVAYDRLVNLILSLHFGLILINKRSALVDESIHHHNQYLGDDIIELDKLEEGELG